jgi:hypothetical protein
MRSMSLLQLVGGVTAAGVVAAGATAMTGMGLTRSGTAADKWVGGTVVQAVTGTNISGVAYTALAGDNTGTKIQQIVITVVDPATTTVTRTMTVELGGGAYGSTAGSADRLYCGDGTNTSTWSSPTATLTIAAGTTSTVTCTMNNAAANATAPYYSGLSSLTIGVA